MRRWLALSVFPCVAACFTSSSSSPGDASFTPGFDASFDTSTSEPEASTDAAIPKEASPEAAIDASVPEAGGDASVDAAVDVAVEAGPSPVVVTVVGGGGPEVGVSIVSNGPTGTYLTTTPTGANGQASIAVPAGGSITALLGDPTQYATLYTVLAVEPGDALKVVDWGSLPSSYSDTRTGCDTVTLSLPAPLPGTASTSASAGACLSESPSPVTLGGNCADVYLASGVGPSGCGGFGSNGRAAFPLLVYAYDENGNELGFLAQKANPLPSAFVASADAGAPDGGDAGTDDLAVSSSWSTMIFSQAVSLLNQSDAGLPLSPALSEAQGGVLLPLTYNGSTWTTHVGYADFVQVEAANTVYYESALAIAQSLPAPATSGTLSLDVSPLATMPVLSGTSIDSTVPSQPVVSWTTSQGSLSTVTGVIAFASWLGGATTGPNQGTWTIVSPAAATSVQPPALGGSASAWLPGAGANYANGNVVVWGVQGSALPTYAAVRAAASAFPETPQCGIESPVIPPLPAANETLMITLWSTAPCD
jgi:hypothetical protein